MKIDLNRLPDYVNEKDMARFDDKFDQFESSANADTDLEDRILSSVIRKAGFEMNNTIIVRKSRKKKLITIAVIAAALVSSAIVAGAYAYKTGLWNGMKNVFTEEVEEPLEEISENKVAALESMTVFDGTLVENTFDGIDIIFEGSIPNIDSHGGGGAYSIFTIRKSDGTAFTEPPEGWRYAIKYGECAYGRNDGFPLYKDSIYNININDDGSISLTLSNWTAGCVLSAIDNKGDHPVYLGFTDLYLEPDWTEGDEATESDKKLGEIFELTLDIEDEFMSACNGSSYLIDDEDNYGVYWTKDPMTEDCELVRNFKEKDVQLQKAHEEIASEVYHGSVLFSVDFSNYEQKVLKFGVECNGEPVNIEISPIRAWISGDGYNAPFGDKKPELILNYKDGETVELELGETGGWGLGSADDWHQYWRIEGKTNEPIDIDNIESIVFEGMTISVDK